jgi:putative transposase
MNMAKSAAGTLENPGRNVKAKSGLNKAILDQGWGMFVDALARKLAAKGGELIKVPPHHTSQKCPERGHVDKANRKTQADFKRVSCGYSNNADVVGALNILTAGQAVVNARGGHGAQSQPMKREPAEGTGAL